MQTQFYAAVVVYNKHCRDSLTCHALAQLPETTVSVLIYDNSTKDFGNRSYCLQKGWTYLGGEGNKGLSVAYNRCVDAIREQGNTGWICLFDDDTQLSGGYFQQLGKSVGEHNCDILVPLIYSGDKLISPCRIERAKHRLKLFPSGEEALSYTGEDITAINSGMAIDLQVFRQYRYDERVFLDGIDHKFTADMLEAGRRIGVMAYRCDHEFSGDSRPAAASALTRFRIFARDNRYIYRSRTGVYCYLVGKRALKLTWIYKDLRFLTYFFTGLFSRNNPN